MAKVLEGPGMDLFKKWGMAVPNHVVLTSADQFDPLAQVNAWMRNSKLVVKAHEAIGSRMKLGLVKLGLKYDAAEKAAKEMLGKDLGGLKVSQLIAITHEYANSNRAMALPGVVIAAIAGVIVEIARRILVAAVDIHQTAQVHR